MRRAIAGLVILVALIVVWRAWPHREIGDSARAKPVSTAGSNSVTEKHGGKFPTTGETAADTFPLVATLNSENSTITHDLDALSQIFDAWRTNFPREGNPFGENAEIAAALGGRNSLGLVLIPRNHRAINPAGELCDRWGTPFRFHQISGVKMEIRSAGPDRKFATDDDAVWNPQ